MASCDGNILFLAMSKQNIKDGVEYIFYFCIIIYSLALWFAESVLKKIFVGV